MPSGASVSAAAPTAVVPAGAGDKPLELLFRSNNT